MKAFILLITFIGITSQAYAQLSPGLSIKSGITISNQSIVQSNNTLLLEPMIGFQGAIAGRFSLTGPLYASAEVGYAQLGSSKVEYFGENRSLNMDYVYTEGGLGIEKKLGKLSPFAGISYRYGHLVNESFSKAYAFQTLSQSDNGLNFKLGFSVPRTGLVPFVEASYYYGLKNIGNNDVIVNGENFTSSIHNRAFSILLGVRF